MTMKGSHLLFPKLIMYIYTQCTILHVNMLTVVKLYVANYYIKGGAVWVVSSYRQFNFMQETFLYMENPKYNVENDVKCVKNAQRKTVENANTACTLYSWLALANVPWSIYLDNMYLWYCIHTHRLKSSKQSCVHFSDKIVEWLKKQTKNKTHAHKIMSLVKFPPTNIPWFLTFSNCLCLLGCDSMHISLWILLLALCIIRYSQTINLAIDFGIHNLA